MLNIRLCAMKLKIKRENSISKTLKIELSLLILLLLLQLIIYIYLYIFIYRNVILKAKICNLFDRSYLLLAVGWFKYVQERGRVIELDH